MLLIACRIYLWSWQFHQSVIYIFEIRFHFEILVHFIFVFICLLFTLNSVVLNIFYCWLWLFDVPPCSMDLSELFVFFFALVELSYCPCNILLIMQLSYFYALRQQCRLQFRRIIPITIFHSVVFILWQQPPKVNAYINCISVHLLSGTVIDRPCLPITH